MGRHALRIGTTLIDEGGGDASSCERSFVERTCRLADLAP